MNVYDFEVKDGNGQLVSLKDYEGKALIILNSATGCGFTPQYDGLQDLYEKYQGQGFEILDFPCNQFGNQAPGSQEEIVEFCQTRYGITFPIFEKIEVNGEKAIPLYQFLVKEKGFEGFPPEHPLTATLDSILGGINPDYKKDPSIKWNFTKFLIDRQGNVAERFEPTTEIDVIEAKLKELL